MRLSITKRLMKKHARLGILLFTRSFKDYGSCKQNIEDLDMGAASKWVEKKEDPFLRCEGEKGEDEIA